MRGRQTVRALVLLVLSWYGMMAVHELGHCVGALVTGAEIEGVAVPLFGFSRTDVSGGRCPLLEVWAGPFLGVVLPLLLLFPCRKLGRLPQQATVFFVGFCLLANGIYIGFGAPARVGDCRELLHHGSPLWLLAVFGLLSSGGGLYALHGLGPFREWFSERRDGDA